MCAALWQGKSMVPRSSASCSGFNYRVTALRPIVCSVFLYRDGIAELAALPALCLEFRLGNIDFTFILVGLGCRSGSPAVIE